MAMNVHGLDVSDGERGVMFLANFGLVVQVSAVKAELGRTL